MRKVAIFGGTFNPIHWGHLLVAETALDQAALDQIIWVPTFRPPHKPQALPAFDQRLEMVQRAIADHPAFSLSSIDMEQKGVSYAIGTLQHLQALYPSTQWFWILGSDTFQTLTKWYKSHLLIEQCTWLVASRWSAGRTSAEAEELGRKVMAQLGSALRWQLLQMPAINISSSLIRQYRLEGRSIRYLVPDPVRIYIEEHKLYVK
ncbi:nicotinate (nicotinamide) nucleotide adenylyltransferase [Leptothermofonsia sp. ETS-13]|uniref:nicotinate (nicotinamide) nucleotide adenylyltransferase n=1 Tax=Leptothermofonsia sp. ETS-13 TaxID=3035696 RepID=UPI003B9F825B